MEDYAQRHFLREWRRRTGEEEKRLCLSHTKDGIGESGKDKGKERKIENELERAGDNRGRLAPKMLFCSGSAQSSSPL